jgi:putative CocE/NonD family hydrolase
MQNRFRWLTGFFLFLSFQAISQSPSPYERQEVMIPMRDGVRLNTVIYTLKNSQSPLPFLLTRTPYGVSHTESPDRIPYVKDMADYGYIFVYQDIRGRYKSEGTFEMQRMSRNKKDPKAIDESTDTYDTIEWLLANIPNNSKKVGMYGISYAGWTTVMGAIDPHPALAAVSEQATPSDMFLGDDFHHNGAFRLSYGFEYAFMEEATKQDSLFPFPNYDTYEWYLKLGPLSNVNKLYFKNKLPSWNDFVNHPNYDSFWQKQSLITRIDRPKIPIMNVAGWWDQEDFYGPLKAYQLWEKQDQSNKNFLVAGPWNHGGWGRSDGRTLGNIQFDTATSVTFRKEIQAPWFAYHLKGKGPGNFPEAITFQTGSNSWQRYDSWPPKEATKRNLYFQADGKLSFEAPKATSGADAYISDPAQPVPYRTRPIEATYGPGSRWRTWLTEDQRFVHNRPDVLSWETDALPNDVTVTGEVWAKLFAATTGRDADWVVKLIDAYPAQYPQQPAMGAISLWSPTMCFAGDSGTVLKSPKPLSRTNLKLIRLICTALTMYLKKATR